MRLFGAGGGAHTDLRTILGSTVVSVHPHPPGDSPRVTNRPEPQEDVIIGWDLWGQTPLNLQVRASCLFDNDLCFQQIQVLQ